MVLEGGDGHSVRSSEGESESEGVLHSMRRRAASDDEGVEQSYVGDQPLRIASGGESDGEGAAAEYDDDERSDGDVEDEELVDEMVDERCEVDAIGDGGVSALVRSEDLRDEEPEKYDGEYGAEGEQKVENVPYAVPTGGAFYMHDDRLRQNGRGGRHRRMPGGQKLWENKDDQVWVHDRFEELNMRDTRHGESRRASRGRFRGRGRGRSWARDADNNFGSVNKTQAYNNDKLPNHVPRLVKGRGPRRFELIKRGKEMSANQNKEHVKPNEVISNSRMSRSWSRTPSAEQASVPRKNVISSNLNYASPPFYPSGSSNKDAYESQRIIEKSGPTNRNPASSYVQLMKGKGLVSSAGYDKLYMEGSVRRVSGRASVSPQLPVSMSAFSSANTGQYSQSMVQERSKIVNELFNNQMSPLVNTSAQVSAPTEVPVVHQSQGVAGRPSVSPQLPASMSAFSSANTGQYSESMVQERSQIINGFLNNQMPPSVNTTAQVSAPSEVFVFHQRQLQNPVPISSRSSTQPIRQQTDFGAQAPTLETSTNSLENGEKELHSEPGKSKSQLVRYAKPNPQAHGKGAILYNNAQVLGATGTVGISNGDRGFQATPTILPFMPIGGQHHVGVGVPAVGVALPGYMAPPHGYGNSEMTCLPVLAGAAGALGATYSPCIALDSGYYARTSVQASSMPTSRENNSSKTAKTPNQSQMPDIPNDELLYRQGKPRRYSEMTFRQ